MKFTICPILIVSSLKDKKGSSHIFRRVYKRCSVHCVQGTVSSNKALGNILHISKHVQYILFAGARGRRADKTGGLLHFKLVDFILRIVYCPQSLAKQINDRLFMWFISFIYTLCLEQHNAMYVAYMEKSICKLKKRKTNIHIPPGIRISTVLHFYEELKLQLEHLHLGLEPCPFPCPSPSLFILRLQPFNFLPHIF